jgi:hypothetical protein
MALALVVKEYFDLIEPVEGMGRRLELEKRFDEVAMPFTQEKAHHINRQLRKEGYTFIDPDDVN